MTHTGQHKRCADCALVRVRRRAPRLQSRYRPRTFGEIWACIGMVAGMERSRDRARRDQLRRRWAMLPARYTQSRVFRLIVERAAAVGVEQLTKVVAELEELAEIGPIAALERMGA